MQDFKMMYEEFYCAAVVGPLPHARNHFVITTGFVATKVAVTNTKCFSASGNPRVPFPSGEGGTNVVSDG